MIHIFTTVCGRTELLELQYRAFQKYVQDEIKFTVFNNSMWDRPHEYENINNTCHRLGIRVIDIEKDPDLIRQCEEIEGVRIFNGRGQYLIINLAAQYSDNWAWRNVISKEPGPICLLHADVFPIQEVRLTDFLRINDLCYLPQSRPGIGGEYMHDALVLANIPKLPDVKSINWCGGKINGITVDGGGQTFHYLQAHPEIPTLQIGTYYTQDNPELSFHPSDYEFYQLEQNRAFLHYRTALNWNGRSSDYHEQKTAWLKKELNLEKA